MNIKRFLGTSAAALLLMTGAAAAQTTGTSTGTSTGTTDTGTGATTIDTNTVGTPNTGAGGLASQYAVVLGVSGAIALAGMGALSRRRGIRIR